MHLHYWGPELFMNLSMSRVFFGLTQPQKGPKAAFRPTVALLKKTQPSHSFELSHSVGAAGVPTQQEPGSTFAATGRHPTRHCIGQSNKCKHTFLMDYFATWCCISTVSIVILPRAHNNKVVHSQTRVLKHWI